ncbi:MAG: hypothetical protein QXW35_02000 [Candidatus Aenigmatarchaeota archaeon]
MKLLEEVAIRFLIGIFIASLIGFLFWWLVIHNETDRIVERNFQKFYSALDEACSRRSTINNPTKVYVEIPQKRFQNPFEAGINWLKEKLGMPVPFTAFHDPYYNFHWEFFPPEPPYTFGQGIIESLAAFFIPWSEDLPWSSNLILTMAFGTFALGVDIFGIKSIKQAGTKFLSTVKNEASKFGEKILNNFDEVKIIVKAVNEIEEYTKQIGKYIIEAKGTIIKIKDISGNIIHEVKFTSKITTMYTLFCLAIEDKTLGDCFVEGVIFGVGADASKLIAKNVVFPRIKKKLEIYYSITVGKIKKGFSEFLGYVSDEIKSMKYKFTGIENIDAKLAENINEINKLSDEIRELLDDAKKLVNEGKNSEALSKLNEAKEKLKKISEIIEDTSKKVPSEYSSIFFLMDVEILKLYDEIDNMIKKLPKDFIEDNFRSFIELNSLVKSIEELHDDIYIRSVQKVLERKGFSLEYDEKLKRTVYVLTEESNKDLFNEFKVAIEARKVIGQKIYSYGDFKFQYDENGNLIKVIYDPFDPGSISSAIKEGLLGYPKKFLAYLEEKAFIHNKLVDGDAVAKVLEDMKDDLQRDENLRKRLLEAFKKIGYKLDEDELIYRIDNTIRKYKSGENLVLVVEKNSELGKLFDKLPSDISPQDLSHYIRKSIYDAIKQGDDTELRNLYGLISGKTLRIKEDMEIFFRRGVIGYATLRAIDLYTPLGASWWDKYISYYGYEGQKIPAGCQTQCDEGKICLQLGACIRQFDLPESCQKIGIKDVKIKRNSIVASDPRFYLVSPCYAELEIFIDSSDATLYVFPKIDKNRLNEPNYCYATENYVNWYIGTYIAQYTTRCASAVGCAILTGGLGAIDAVLACLFGAASGVCGVIADLIDLTFSFLKESTFVWPTVYKTYPWLI